MSYWCRIWFAVFMLMDLPAGTNHNAIPRQCTVVTYDTIEHLKQLCNIKDTAGWGVCVPKYRDKIDSTLIKLKNDTMPNVLKFTKNWNNKLFCDCFTSIRIDQDKYQVGHQYEATLFAPDGKAIFTKYVTCVTKTVLTIDQITESMAWVDTGMNADKCRGMIKKMYEKSVTDWASQKFAFMVFAKL